MPDRIRPSVNAEKRYLLVERLQIAASREVDRSPE